jgi:antitoxin VapB
MIENKTFLFSNLNVLKELCWVLESAHRNVKLRLDMIYIMIYTFYRRIYMQTARLFNNGRSQAVRLPKEYQFKGENVFIRKVGEAVLLVPVDKDWETFLHGLNSFSEDFMAEKRSQGKEQTREEL